MSEGGDNVWHKSSRVMLHIVCVSCVCSIFLGSGWPSTRVAKYFKGDVVACELDFDEVKAKFYKNNELVGYARCKTGACGDGMATVLRFHS